MELKCNGFTAGLANGCKVDYGKLAILSSMPLIPFLVVIIDIFDIFISTDSQEIFVVDVLTSYYREYTVL